MPGFLSPAHSRACAPKETSPIQLWPHHFDLWRGLLQAGREQMLSVSNTSQ
jgi:hypothetical protein